MNHILKTPKEQMMRFSIDQSKPELPPIEVTDFFAGDEYVDMLDVNTFPEEIEFLNSIQDKFEEMENFKSIADAAMSQMNVYEEDLMDFEQFVRSVPAIMLNYKSLIDVQDDFQEKMNALDLPLMIKINILHSLAVVLHIIFRMNSSIELGDEDKVHLARVMHYASTPSIPLLIHLEIKREFFRKLGR